MSEMALISHRTSRRTGFTSPALELRRSRIIVGHGPVAGQKSFFKRPQHGVAYPVTMRIFLTGSTGFVGRHMLQRLLAEGHTVRALVREPARAAAPGQSGVEFVPGDVVEGVGLDQGMKGCDAVVHLVGIIVESGGNTFARVHHLGARNVVEAAKRAGIARFIHMSALGVRADGAAAYQATKWRGEEEVRKS